MKNSITILIMAAFCSCSTSSGIRSESGEVTKRDLFHHINMISNQFPEYNSRQILKSSNPDFFLYANLYLNPNEEEIEELENRDKILAMNFKILNGKSSEKEALEKLSPLFYHHANYISTKDEGSRKFLEMNSKDLYRHALCLVVPAGNHLAKLKPE